LRSPGYDWLRGVFAFDRVAVSWLRTVAPRGEDGTT